MAEQQSGKSFADVVLLPLEPEMPRDELLSNLRMNALLSHQISMGRGDELVQLLKRAITQMEKTHGRIQNMSTILFVAGLVLLATGVAMIAFGGSGQEVWAVLMGTTGGVTALAATFWTAPLDKMAESINDLVKLEVAFLGYIRVVGEIDSAFQMQYLDNLANENATPIDNVLNDTTAQMQKIMEHTLQLIDKHVVGQGKALSELQESVADMTEQFEKYQPTLETMVNQSNTASKEE